jgi:DNA-binding beta-propeller fold protein YncE
MQSTFINGMAVLGVGAAAIGIGTRVGADDHGLTPVGGYDSGSGEGGSEIVAVDTFSDRMFITNGEQNRIDIVDISDPDAPSFVDSVDMSPFGEGIQSVAVGHKIVAAAAHGGTLESGTVVLFGTDGVVIDDDTVGVLPDSIAFTPNGRYIVVANEAEPVCVNDETAVDPEGSMSIIDIHTGSVETADFTEWIGEETTLEAAGARIFFPASNAAQALERRARGPRGRRGRRSDLRVHRTRAIGWHHDVRHHRPGERHVRGRREHHDVRHDRVRG